MLCVVLLTACCSAVRVSSVCVLVNFFYLFFVFFLYTHFFIYDRASDIDGSIVCRELS